MEQRTLGKRGAVILVSAAMVVVLVAVGFFFFTHPKLEGERSIVEYAFAERNYEMKDGTVLRLGFSLLVPQEEIQAIQQMVEAGAAEQVFSQVSSLIALKSHDDLVRSALDGKKLEAEIARGLQEGVFQEGERGKEGSVELAGLYFYQFTLQPKI